MHLQSRTDGVGNQMVPLCGNEDGRRGSRDLFARPEDLSKRRAGCASRHWTLPSPRTLRMELTSSTLVDKLMPELSTLFDTIRDQSRDGAGVTRDAFGPRETQAADTLAAFARRKGLEAGSGAAGNLHVTAGGPGGEPRRLLPGSPA